MCSPVGRPPVLHHPIIEHLADLGMVSALVRTNSHASHTPSVSLAVSGSFSTALELVLSQLIPALLY